VGVVTFFWIHEVGVDLFDGYVKALRSTVAMGRELAGFGRLGT
jgi:hypothetical protein